jgi:ribose 5-phosphate isomerase B
MDLIEEVFRNTMQMVEFEQVRHSTIETEAILNRTGERIFASDKRGSTQIGKTPFFAFICVIRVNLRLNKFMADSQNDTRDRVRALVREVLATVPTELDDLPSDKPPEHVVVNSLKGTLNKEWERDESAKQLITEDDLRGLAEGSKVRVAENARLTPLANDIVREKRIELIRKQGRQSTLKVRTIAIGADHGGYPMKEKLKEFLAGFPVQINDFGTNSTDAVDYPDHAHAVAKAVSEARADIGIIIDGAGIGSAMTANKVPGVRAAACYNVSLAQNSREHNGANVLTLGSGQNTVEELRDIVTAFLTSELTEERHKRRVGKIDSVEKQYKR